MTTRNSSARVTQGRALERLRAMPGVFNARRGTYNLVRAAQAGATAEMMRRARFGEAVIVAAMGAVRRRQRRKTRAVDVASFSQVGAVGARTFGGRIFFAAGAYWRALRV